MTEEELLAQKKANDIEAQRKAKALEDEKIARDKSTAEATKIANQTTLDKNKLVSQGDTAYAGAKAEFQGGVLDQFSGFGKDTTGAGVARAEVRKDATGAALTDIENQYKEKTQGIQDTLNATNADLDFQQKQTDQSYNNTLTDIENNYNYAEKEMAYNQAEKARKEKEAADAAAAAETQKLKSNQANSIITQINKGKDKDGTKYTQQQIDTILSNAKAMYGFDDDMINTIRSKTMDNSDIFANASVVEDDNDQTLANFEVTKKDLNKLESDRYKNSVSWFRRTVDFDNFRNNYEKINASMYNQLNNPQNFARDSENMANTVLSQVQNGEITPQKAQELFKSHNLVKDIDAMQDLGYLTEKQVTTILGKMILLGVNPTL